MFLRNFRRNPKISVGISVGAFEGIPVNIFEEFLMKEFFRNASKTVFPIIIPLKIFAVVPPVISPVSPSGFFLLIPLWIPVVITFDVLLVTSHRWIPPETPFVISSGFSPIVIPYNPPVIPPAISCRIPHGILLAAVLKISFRHIWNKSPTTYFRSWAWYYGTWKTCVARKVLQEGQEKSYSCHIYDEYQFTQFEGYRWHLPLILEIEHFFPWLV